MVIRNVLTLNFAMLGLTYLFALASCNIGISILINLTLQNDIRLTVW